MGYRRYDRFPSIVLAVSGEEGDDEQSTSPRQPWQSSGPGEGDNVDRNVLPYCSINKAEKKTIGEMEQDFLQAMQSFYYDGKAIMSNKEFDNLKEELMWKGSSVVMLSSDKQRFLEASVAYVSGKLILNDEEYDKLKLKLKMDGSEIVCEDPRCSPRSKKIFLPRRCYGF